MNLRPNFETPYRLRRFPVPFAVWLGCHLGTLLWLNTAHARIAIHVHGTSELAGAVVTAPTGGDAQIQGRLQDELGTSIAGATLQLSLVDQAHKVTSLTELRNCVTRSATTRDNGTRSPNSGSSVVTATDGSFCVRLVETEFIPGASVQLRYDGSLDYTGTQQLLAPPDLRLALTGQFEAPTRTIPLDAETTTFRATLSPAFEQKLVEPPTLAVALSLLDSALSPDARLLQRSMTKVGEPTTLTLNRASLGLPGPAELVLRFDGNDRVRPLLLSRKFLRTANVAMDPLELPNRVTAGDTFRTVCILRSRFGLVTSGSVELTTNGTRQALLPVGKDGRAAFVIATQKNQPKLSLDFHYVPALEGFVAPPPQTITITLHPPTPWRFTGWVIAGLLVVGWLGWSRRQPPKVQEEHRPTVPQPPRAHIEILGPTSDQNVGWEGLVVDAHEGHPLGSVRIALLQQGFGRSTVLFETHSDGDGAFRIPRSAVQKGTYCELVVETIAYASFATELPPPGQVRLYLVSVRRAILDRLVVWAKRRGVPYRSKSEPTPDWVAEVARQRGNRDLEQWAQAVSTAAFGKEPPLDAQSRELLPPTGPDVGPGPSKSSES